MVLTDTESSPPDGLPPGPMGEAPRSVPADRIQPSRGTSRLLVVVAIAALVAGAASLVAGEVIVKAYEGDLFPKLKIRPTAEDMRRLGNARIYSAALSLAVLGGLLGLAMGLAGGVARRSTSSSARAAILGLFLGAGVAVSMAFVFVSVFYKWHDPQSGDLLVPLLTQGAIWSSVGAIGGLAFGLGLGGQGRWRATLVGGLAGAVAATIVYEIVGALAFPANKTDQPLSSSITTRAMAHLLVAIFSAVGAVLALRKSESQ
jgi:MFS family permease